MAPSIPLHFPHQETQRSTGYINKIMVLPKCRRDQVPTVSFRTCIIFVRLTSTCALPEHFHLFQALRMQSVSAVGQRLSLDTCWSQSSAWILRKKCGFSQSTAQGNQPFSHARIPLQLHLYSSSPKAPCQPEFFPSLFLLHPPINKYYPRLMSASSWLMVE